MYIFLFYIGEPSLTEDRLKRKSKQGTLDRLPYTVCRKFSLIWQTLMKPPNLVLPITHIIMYMKHWLIF